MGKPFDAPTLAGTLRRLVAGASAATAG
jgi:hypothetical protein